MTVRNRLFATLIPLRRKISSILKRSHTMLRVCLIRNLLYWKHVSHICFVLVLNVYFMVVPYVFTNYSQSSQHIHFIDEFLLFPCSLYLKGYEQEIGCKNSSFFLKKFAKLRVLAKMASSLPNPSLHPL